jgi:hypothetical protein
MATSPKQLKVTFTVVAGDWGEQIGWVTITNLGLVPGLGLNRLGVLHDLGAKVIRVGISLTPGDRTGAWHDAITFDSEHHRRIFKDRLLVALRVARPELFPSANIDVAVDGVGAVGDAGAAS